MFSHSSTLLSSGLIKNIRLTHQNISPNASNFLSSVLISQFSNSKKQFDLSLSLSIPENGVTSYKVAKEAGVTQTALSNWKSGRSTPTTKTLQKIADYFGVTIDYLMTGKDVSASQDLTL